MAPGPPRARTSNGRFYSAAGPVPPRSRPPGVRSLEEKNEEKKLAELERDLERAMVTVVWWERRRDAAQQRLSEWVVRMGKRKARLERFKAQRDGLDVRARRMVDLP